jgi:hypothetical protein
MRLRQARAERREAPSEIVRESPHLRAISEREAVPRKFDTRSANGHGTNC